jgi:hypothetical protein
VRLATLGLSHETNTFARLPATYARFEEDGILRGNEIVREYADSHATLAGYPATPDLTLSKSSDCPDPKRWTWESTNTTNESGNSAIRRVRVRRQEPPQRVGQSVRRTWHPPGIEVEEEPQMKTLLPRFDETRAGV